MMKMKKEKNKVEIYWSDQFNGHVCLRCRLCELGCLSKALKFERKFTPGLANRYDDELIFYKEKCTGCLRCVEACPERGILGTGIKSFKGLGKIYWLTKDIRHMWLMGHLNKTWLNFKLNVNYVIGLSGECALFIRVSNPREVTFEDVHEEYKRCVNPSKKIYVYDAVLERVEKRVRVNGK